jgi:hypothetical protein
MHTHTHTNFQGTPARPRGPQRDRSALHHGPPTFKSMCACMHAATVSTAVTRSRHCPMMLPSENRQMRRLQRAHAHRRKAGALCTDSIDRHPLMGNPCMWTVNVRVDPHACLRARAVLHARMHACAVARMHACFFTGPHLSKLSSSNCQAEHARRGTICTPHCMP